MKSVHVLASMFVLMGCDSVQIEPLTAEFCGNQTELFIEDQIGRIYSIPFKEGRLIFIGSMDSSNPGPGFIPCNGEEFKLDATWIGTTVQISGRILENNQSADQDPYDPYHTGIQLERIDLKK